MRKYVVRVAVAGAVATMGLALAAGAGARQVGHAQQGRRGFIVIRHGRQHVSLYVDRSHHNTTAHAASCPAGGPYGVGYCVAPMEQNLFGAYGWDNGSVTFGSNSSSTCKSLGYPSTAKSCGVYTTQPNTLIAAFVSAEGSGQSMTVSCTTASGGACPVTFHKVNSENAAGGDAEVWYADATNVISQSAPIFVTAKDTKADCGFLNLFACDASLQAITFTSAITPMSTGAQLTGIGASSVCFSAKAAPSCSLKTTESDSLVWASLNNPSAAVIPTWPSNQFAVGIADGSDGQTYYSQFLGTCTSNANGSKPCTVPTTSNPMYQNLYVLAPTATPVPGTTVTINDTTPTTNAFNEVAIEIL